MEGERISRVENGLRVDYDDCCKPSGSGVEGDIASNEREGLLSQEDAQEPVVSRREELEQRPASSKAQERQQNKAQAHLVAVPIEKLQQLVELCSQVLRESRTKHPGEPDLEQGLVYGNETIQTALETNSILTDPRLKNIFGLSYPRDLPPTYESRKESIEDIWNRVQPWQIKKVSVTADGYIFSKNISSFTHKDLPLLFKCNNQESNWNGLDAAVLNWRYKGTFCRFGESGKILVVACCCCTEFDEKLQIGAILECCYQNGILKQPDSDEGYKWHILLIIMCSYSLNRTVHIDILLAAEKQGAGSPYAEFDSIFGLAGDHILEMLTRRNSLQEVLGMDIAGMFQILHMLNPTPGSLESSFGPTLRVDDLNISALKSIGELEIRWTALAEDHLRLDLEKMTLSIAWSELPGEFSAFGKLQQLCIGSLPSTFLNQTRTRTDDALGKVDKAALDTEVLQSWSFLFATSKSEKTRSQEYDKLSPPPWSPAGIPIWLKADHLGTVVRGEHSLYYGQDYINETILREVYSSIQTAALRKNPISYARFPIFETRLRELRHYMDSRKPRGLRQLWKDNRDSLNYYTFWGVIILGGLGVFLAICSLAVSIAQTVASFRALEGTVTVGTSSK